MAYTWPDGSKNHTISWQQHLQNTGTRVTSSPAGTVQISAAGQAALNRIAGGAGGVYSTSPQGTVVISPAGVNTLNQIRDGGPGPAAPGTTPQPYDPSLDQAALIANRNVALAQGEGAYQLGNLGFDYGYNPDGSLNTANPYSRAALYQLAYTNSKRATTNSMAAQGQLYSGAYGHQQGLNDQAYAQNEAANRLAFQRAVHGVQSGQLNTYANAGTGVSDTDFQALLKATYGG